MLDAGGSVGVPVAVGPRPGSDDAAATGLVTSDSFSAGSTSPLENVVEDGQDRLGHPAAVHGQGLPAPHTHHSLGARLKIKNIV